MFFYNVIYILIHCSEIDIQMQVLVLCTCVWNGWRRKDNESWNGIIKTRFVTNHNSIEFVHENAQTISFVERGFERLDLGHQAVGFSWYPYMVKSSSPLESFSRRRAGRLWFFAIFPSLLYELLTFPFILACIFYPSSTCRIDIPRLILVPSAHTQSGWGWL